jgi:hypothetical protein
MQLNGGIDDQQARLLLFIHMQNADDRVTDDLPGPAKKVFQSNLQ